MLTAEEASGFVIIALTAAYWIYVGARSLIARYRDA